VASQRIRTATAQLKLPLYVVTLWLALATALLSSLMPGGLPRTTVLGSAFNPATTAVALQPTRAQPRMLVESVRRDDDPVGGQGDTIRAAFPSVPLAVHPAVAADAPKPSAAAVPTGRQPAMDGSPRGPPLP
jgi:hypothetical protein